MWEIAADLAVLVGDGPLRALRARRAHRRLRAGLQARVPCSIRSERPGWPAAYENGSLLFTPGRPTAAFGSRAYPWLEFGLGGEHRDPEPEDWFDPDWAATGYLPPDGGPTVFVQVHTRYLTTTRLALGGPVDSTV
ncbi:hypothetical protein [Kitasatospora sp. NPDC085879]|uniref:hypothetical protein n=1 Tax=Kitasatospora sp. NPDC085879 TaxID=3154769 RepID=UPI000BB0DB9E|nr:hypothetical protein [Streptomyces sp. TLI_235]PBC79460.1 hypothetical protein BX265_4262 [Streptomyces sp. TLI_235]